MTDQNRAKLTPAGPCFKTALLLALSCALAPISIDSALAGQAGAKPKLAQSFKPYQPGNKWLPTPDAPEFQPGPQTGDETNNRQQSPQRPQPAQQSQPPQPQQTQQTQQPEPQDQGSPFVVNPDGTPALNIVAPTERPQIPPPPATPDLPLSEVAPSPSAAWRVKAFQLFKSNKFDAPNQLTFTLAAAPQDALNSLRQAAEEEGLAVPGQAPAAGQMLITYSDHSESRPEKAIIAMRPRAVSAQADDPEAQQIQTDIRVQCENRNRILTVTRLREILNRLSAGMGNARTRSETF